MVVISPYSKQLKSGKRNPKNYPYWDELIRLLNSSGYNIGIPKVTQLRYEGEPKLDDVGFYMNMPFSNMHSVFKNENVFISVDNFFPHFCHFYGIKSVVLWGQSDPRLFGYQENINILKDEKYLRPNQFGTWEEAEYIEEAFASPEEVFQQIKHLL